MQELDVTGASANLYARGRAFGASLTGVYSVNDNIYVRAGFLTKIGGKTEAITHLELQVPVAPDVYAPLVTDFTTEFNGKFPSGFVGAVGYKFPVGDNLNLFAELEYMGINVTRDVSNSTEFSATLGGSAIDKATLTGILSGAGLDALIPLYSDTEIKWGEGPYPSNEAPYSSFGINFGITYTFNKK